MARGKGKKGAKGPNGIKRNKFTGEAYTDIGYENPDENAEKFIEALGTAAQGVAGFAKSLVEGSAEVKRAEAAFYELKSTLALPAFQGAAGLISPGAANFVGGARGLLGEATAAGNAAGELENYAAQAAFNGLPLDKDLESSIFPLLQARQRSVEQARQQAADVTGEQLGGQVKDKASAYAEFLGIGDIFRGLIGGGSARVP